MGSKDKLSPLSGFRYFAILFAVAVLLLPSLGWGRVEVGPTAIFSQQQSFWPQVSNQPDRIESQNPFDSLRVFVLPLARVFMDEKPICDSCDRLTPAVLEFSMPSWHRDFFSQLLPGHFEVLAQGEPLLMGDTSWFDTVSCLSSLPWKTWLSAPSHGIVYRARDHWVTDSTRLALTLLGGKLGASHLLLLDSVRVKLRPWSRGAHHGSYGFEYGLILWNVRSSQPEWATQIHLSGPFWSDLDAPWGPKLSPVLEQWYRNTPQNLQKLWDEEPH